MFLTVCVRSETAVQGPHIPHEKEWDVRAVSLKRRGLVVPSTSVACFALRGCVCLVRQRRWWRRWALRHIGGGS